MNNGQIILSQINLLIARLLKMLQYNRIEEWSKRLNKIIAGKHEKRALECFKRERELELILRWMREEPQNSVEKLHSETFESISIIVHFLAVSGPF